ncbi:uncharacterized protein LOC110032281 isoform X2 [Phalaenopsis equestris]|uniref:uncharacterized protein LOC110032281 isoform X2 n=1 Tax=Phalaenopsis equestris TaxID=78828 RepID=UPI0009E3CF37|nr:uncharacterized protein LOC110032281 isoform X2 [Phalaenopsis equestris]
MATAEAHLLRLAVSCRKLTAHVTAGATDAIIAMASSGEQEFAAANRYRLYRYPRSRRFWDERVAARLGEKLAVRLRQIGISDVQLHLEDGDRERLSLTHHYRRSIASLFHSVERAGIRVDGADELRCDRDPQAGKKIQ